MDMPKKIKEPQDVADVGPTPYEYLFSETAERVDGFIDKVKESLDTSEDAPNV